MKVKVEEALIETHRIAAVGGALATLESMKIVLDEIQDSSNKQFRGRKWKALRDLNDITIKVMRDYVEESLARIHDEIDKLGIKL